MNVKAGTRAEEVVRSVAQDAVDSGREIGIQAVAYLDGEKVIDIAEGVMEVDSQWPVDHDTLFNVFSVSKAICSVCLHILIDRGIVGYDDPVVRYWPEFGRHGKEATTIRHVLGHSSGVPQMPEGITADMLGDWDMIVARIADLEPVAPPGSRPLYQPLTHGWLIGEIIRRADPQHRDFRTFLREELCEPLDAPDIWMGVTDAELPRVATLYSVVPERVASGLSAAAMPPPLALAPHVFGRADVRRCVVPAVGGICSARSLARMWAMLAQGGILQGRRVLSESLVATFDTPGSAERDIVMYDQVMPLSIAGFWLGMPQGSTAAARDRHVICHPGAGNTIAWADRRTGLAVSICHNRMYKPASRDEDAVRQISDAIRDALGVV